MFVHAADTDFSKLSVEAYAKTSSACMVKICISYLLVAIIAFLSPCGYNLASWYWILAESIHSLINIPGCSTNYCSDLQCCIHSHCNLKHLCLYFSSLWYNIRAFGWVLKSNYSAILFIVAKIWLLYTI